MKIVLQRVSYGSVKVENKLVGEINKGLVLLIGIGKEDQDEDLKFWANKCCNLRVFSDENGKMNLSVLDISGEILAVSQFTLYGNCKKGRRPSFIDAAPPEIANQMYEKFVSYLKHSGLRVETGVFQASMDVTIHNDGPVTLILGND